MALKAPQTVPAAAPPTGYDDDLVARCFPHVFRKIGDPYGYLDSIGIDAVLEYIVKGHLLIDVAEATNVPLLTLRNWVEDRQFFEKVDEAETHSAEGYLAKAHRAISHANTEFQLRKAKEMAKVGEFMASKKNKRIYGESTKNGEAPPPVQYVFNIGSGKEAAPVIDAVATRIAKDSAADVSNPVSLAVDWQPPTEADVMADASIGGELKLVLVADRPKKPTPTDPDIGPFYDEVVA